MASYFDDVIQYIGLSSSRIAEERTNGFEKKFQHVLKTGRLPENGFSEEEIETLLHRFALLDSNNWTHSSGVGEREGRILLHLVKRRHYGLAHGIGRSGDVTAVQPKAPGSSLLNKLVNSLLLDWLRRSGTPSTDSCFLVPMATGMSLSLCLLTLAQRRGPTAKYVIWPRIDQKSCLKCIRTAGLIPIPIEPLKCASKVIHKNHPKGLLSCQTNLPTSVSKLESTDSRVHTEIYIPELPPKDQLGTDLDALVEAIEDPVRFISRQSKYKFHHSSGFSTNMEEENSGPHSVVCVFTTTSCFAPRVPDRLVAVSRLCAKYGIPHLVNNAYGVQSKRCMRLLESSWKTVCENNRSQVLPTSMTANGETTNLELSEFSNTQPVSAKNPIDFLFVQSSDKNLMVPVGGAIVAGFSGDLVRQVAEMYPGRASGSPAIDVFSTLLHLGWAGWSKLIAERESCFSHLSEGLEKIALNHHLRLMQTPDNPISLALSLDGLGTVNDPETFTQLGSKLFVQGCSGVRIVIPAVLEESSGSDPKTVAGVTLPGFNSHSSYSSDVYLNAAAAIGQTHAEIHLFLSRLDKVLTNFKRSINISSPKSS